MPLCDFKYKPNCSSRCTKWAMPLCDFKYKLPNCSSRCTKWAMPLCDFKYKPNCSSRCTKWAMPLWFQVPEDRGTLAMGASLPGSGRHHWGWDGAGQDHPDDRLPRCPQDQQTALQGVRVSSVKIIMLLCSLMVSYVLPVGRHQFFPHLSSQFEVFKPEGAAWSAVYYHTVALFPNPTMWDVWF